MSETLVNDEILSERLKKGDVDETWRLVLSPDWILRPDEKRALIIQVSRDIGEARKHGKLDPQRAIVLALFDGDRTVGEVYTEASSLFESPPEAVRDSLLLSFFNSHPDAFQLSDGDKGHRVYDPADFIVPAGEIDLTTNRLYRPMGMLLHIADSCVRDCIYCNTQRRPTGPTEALSTGQILDVIDRAAELGVITISVAGGDPFVRKDIPEIMERILQRGIFSGISTKAYVSEKTARRLREVGVESMQVSIDAPTKEMADFLAGSVGFFEEAIQSIKNLRSAGIRVRTNCIMTSFNVRMGPQLIDLLASLDVYRISLSPYARSLHNGALGDSLFVNYRDGKWLEEEVLKSIERYPHIQIKSFAYPVDYRSLRPKDRERSFPERSSCSAGKSGFVVLEDGTMILCEECPIIDELIVGNVKEDSLVDLWNSPRISEITHPPREKYKGTACYDCPDFDECHDGRGRCWRESLKAYGKLYAPSPMCPRAPKGKRIY